MLRQPLELRRQISSVTCIRQTGSRPSTKRVETPEWQETHHPENTERLSCLHWWHKINARSYFAKHIVSPLQKPHKTLPKIKALDMEMTKSTTLPKIWVRCIWFQTKSKITSTKILKDVVMALSQSCWLHNIVIQCIICCYPSSNRQHQNNNYS